MNGLLGGVKPSPGRLCACIDRLDPTSPLSHDWCTVKTDPPPSLVVMVRLLILSSEQGFFSTLNHCHMDLISLIGFTHHHHQQQLPTSQLHEKE